MNYELLFYSLVAFLAGRFSKSCSEGAMIYIGSDRAKYDNARIGILLRK